MLVSLGGPIEYGVMQNILASPMLKVRVSHELEHGLSCNRRSRLHHTDGLGRVVEESTKASGLGNLGSVVLTSLINSKYMIRYFPKMNCDLTIQLDRSASHMVSWKVPHRGSKNIIVSRTFPCTTKLNVQFLIAVFAKNHMQVRRGDEII